ncbi:PIN domain-containing protein, partial [Pseudohaliea sp.]|uniref:PIN domain-containing protein n=1 Tax=Pseudohaliea sp. TaxID=2740289 RepID=UPI0032ED7BDC
SRKSMTVVDANVILRYLLDDHKSLSTKARKIIDPAVGGERDLFVPQAVLAECVYVLEKLYKVPRLEIADSLDALLAFKGIETHDAAASRMALQWYSGSRVDFVDALVLATAHAQGVGYASFDKDLGKLERRLS